MALRQRIRAICVAPALLIAVASAASAQSGLAGAVRDTSGAVLPGVTVEASSPALIEKVRTVVTDGQGQYKIIDLRPGVYSVTFTLPGFSLVKREGIELPTNFTATVNADLRVGEMAETITVTGQTPLVDVQNVTQNRVVNTETVDTLPTARTFHTLSAVIPGITIAANIGPTGYDVGGSAGDKSQTLMIHGGRSTDMVGMLEGSWNTSGQVLSTAATFIDSGSIQEFDYQLGAIAAEHQSGGIKINMIPKDGGNQFKGMIFGTYGKGSLQSDNITPSLIARGLPAVNHLDKSWDLNPSIGGPLKRDKLWFYLSSRYWGATDFVAGSWYDKDPNDRVYTPDLTRRGYDDAWQVTASLRPTWQFTPKNKLTGYFLRIRRCVCHQTISGLVPPEVAIKNDYVVDHKEIVTWTSTVTNKILIQAQLSHTNAIQNQVPEPDAPKGGIPIIELTTGLLLGAPRTSARNEQGPVYEERVTVSYVTGSHAFKAGVGIMQVRRRSYSLFSDLFLNLFNGVPRSIQVNTTPYFQDFKLNAMLGLFAQDQWTIDRLTLNLGIRYDYQNGKLPAVHLPATRLIGARDFAEIPNIPNWKDVSPRLGASYDAFGNGKTALKVTLSRYVVSDLFVTAGAVNPVVASVNNTTRTWTDTNGNFYPDCDLLIPTLNGECGPLANSNFGRSNITTRYDPAITGGFGVRPYNWETSAGLQHELLPGMSVNATYFRRWYGNFTATQNLAVTPADFDPFCVTAPSDPNLPGGGGNQICGFYDVKPAKFGQFNNLVTRASVIGDQWEHYNGFDLTTNARLRHGVQVAGGVTIGRTETNNCDVVIGHPEVAFVGSTAGVIQPRVESNCHVTPPFQPSIKFLASGSLPWDLRASTVIQSVAGAQQITANYVATNAQISPTLGRPLSSGATGTANVALVPDGVLYTERLNQVDFRLSKIFRMGRARLQANMDLYNLLNASPVLVQNNTYGSAWQQPTYVLPGRLFKFGAQLDF